MIVQCWNATQYYSTETVLLIFPSSRPTSLFWWGQVEVRGMSESSQKNVQTFSCSRAMTRDWLCEADVLKELFLCSSSTLLCSMYLHNSQHTVWTTGRLLTEKGEETDIVNFSPLCPTILSGSLRFRSFKYFFSCNYISSPNKVITLIHM